MFQRLNDPEKAQRLRSRPTDRAMRGDARLAGHPAESADLSFQGERLGCEFPMLQGVPVPSRCPAASTMHAADAIKSRTAGDWHGFRSACSVTQITANLTAFTEQRRLEPWPGARIPWCQAASRRTPTSLIGQDFILGRPSRRWLVWELWERGKPKLDE
jgi:hypothetical protein